MSKPSAEFLPGFSPAVPHLFCKSERLKFVLIEHVGKLAGSSCINDYSVFFIVEPQAACVEVSRTHGTKLSVNHDNLGVMETVEVNPNVRSAFHQLMHVVVTTVGREGNITFRAYHQFNLYSTLNSPLKGALDGRSQREIGVDNLDRVAGVIDGTTVKLADYLWCPGL